MKKQIFALLPNIQESDKLINDLHNKLGIDKNELAYVYRDADGEKVEGDGTDVASDTVREGALDGAQTGALIGGAVGLAAVFGLAGPLGPVVAAGPIAAALGLSGAVATTTTGAVLGAATGGVVGALTSLGVDEPKAREYEQHVHDGKVLVSIHTDNEEDVVTHLREYNAEEIQVIEETV